MIACDMLVNIASHIIRESYVGSVDALTLIASRTSGKEQSFASKSITDPVLALRSSFKWDRHSQTTFIKPSTASGRRVMNSAAIGIKVAALTALTSLADTKLDILRKQMQAVGEVRVLPLSEKSFLELVLQPSYKGSVSK
jgi:hypothetical protein